MLNQETSRILEEAEELYKRIERLGRFTSKYEVVPIKERERICGEMQKLSDSISTINPRDENQVYLVELKRRLNGDSSYMEHIASGKLYNFNLVLDILQIQKEDIDFLKPWLEANKDKTLEAIERLYHSREVEGFELSLSRDIPSVKRQAEEVVKSSIDKYHRIIGKFLQGVTKSGEFLRDISSDPTSQNRSYFNTLTYRLAISMGNVCFQDREKNLHINERELIRIYGHEGMGHALNFSITSSGSGSLPYFLTKDSAPTVATSESLAQFYERVIFEDLMKSPETQRKLGVEHYFAEIYQEAKDLQLLNDYKSKQFQYGIVILGDKILGDSKDPKVIKKKTEILSQMALDKDMVTSFMQKNKDEFDSDGNLNAHLVSELRYCARPVQRALEEFAVRGIEYESEGRSPIDSTFYRGFWTPIGFVDNARIVAEANKKD